MEDNTKKNEISSEELLLLLTDPEIEKNIDYQKTAHFLSYTNEKDGKSFILEFRDENNEFKNGDKFIIPYAEADKLTQEKYDDREWICQNFKKIN